MEKEKKRKSKLTPEQRSENARKAAQAPRRMTDAARAQRAAAGKNGGNATKEKHAAHKEKRKEEKRRTTLPAYTRSDIVAYRLAAYIVRAREEERPLTETGLIVALGIDKTTYDLYARGERDHLTAADKSREDNTDINIEIEAYKNNIDIQSLFNYIYIPDNMENNEMSAPSLSNVIQKARLLVTLEREERLARSGRVGDIFTLKAREGWQDEKKQTTNILNITTNNAEEALKLLGFQQQKQIEE